EQHHHGHGFPRGGMLPRGHVAARRERRALDTVVEPAAPLQHPQYAGGVSAREREAPRKGQEQADDRERDGVEKGPQEQEAGEEQRADELHERPAHAAAGAGRRAAQPGSRDRSATPANSPRSWASRLRRFARSCGFSSMTDRKSTRLNSSH